MSDPDKAIAVILSHEGGLVDHPADPGGLTNMGITLETLRDFRGHQATSDELRHLTRADAIAIYRDGWWDKYGYGRIADQNCATKVLDCAVNMGPKRAHVLAQQATNALGVALPVDGILGEHSIEAINACDPTRWLYSMCHQQMGFYQDLAERKPELAVFRKGWLARAAWPFAQNDLSSSEPLELAAVPPAKVIA